MNKKAFKKRMFVNKPYFYWNSDLYENTPLIEQTFPVACNANETKIDKRNTSTSLVPLYTLLPVLSKAMLPPVIERNLPAVIEKKVASLIDKEAKKDKVKSQSINLSKERFTLGELLSIDIENIPFLVEKLIPENTLTFLAGASDVGKSLLYTQLVLCIVMGKDEFVGCKISAKHKRVLIVSTEDGAVAISIRLKKQLCNATIDQDKLEDLILITGSTNPKNRIEGELKNGKFDLVVIDAFADIYGDDINTSNRVRTFLDGFTQLISKYGCSLLIVHHIGKGKERLSENKGHLLGSVGIEGKARQVLILSKDNVLGNIRRLVSVKGNYLTEEEKKNTLVMEFDPTTLTYKTIDEKSPVDLTDKNQFGIVSSRRQGRKENAELEEMKSKARQLYKEGWTLEKIGKELGRDKSTISRWFSDDKGPQYDTSKVGVVN